MIKLDTWKKTPHSTSPIDTPYIAYSFQCKECGHAWEDDEDPTCYCEDYLEQLDDEGDR